MISQEIKKDILINCQDKIRDIAQQDLFICILYQNSQNISFSNIQEWHKIDSFFYDYYYRIEPRNRHFSIAFNIFWNICYELSNIDYIKTISKSSKLGNMFLAAKLPLVDCKQNKFSSFAKFDRDTVEFFFENTFLFDFEDERFSNLITNNCEAIFGLYVIFAVYLESCRYHQINYPVKIGSTFDSFDELPIILDEAISCIKNQGQDNQWLWRKNRTAEFISQLLLV